MVQGSQKQRGQITGTHSLGTQGICLNLSPCLSMSLIPTEDTTGCNSEVLPWRGEEGPTVESSSKERLGVLVVGLVAAAGGLGSRMNTCSSAHLQSKGDKTAWLLVLLQGAAQERPAHSRALVKNQASANVPTYTSIKDAIEQEDK